VILLAYAHQSLTAQQALQIETVTAQRIATRQPLAYLLGEAWLVGLRFVVDPRVIVPRSFIAELLDEGALDPWLTESPNACSICAPALVAWPFWPRSSGTMRR
jgi:[LSU ribosomal protein L3P]-glutamine N5-methyltransferase (EC 2.1.1.-)